MGLETLIDFANILIRTVLLTLTVLLLTCISPLTVVVPVIIASVAPTTIERLVSSLWYIDLDRSATHESHVQRINDGHVWALENCVARGILTTTEYTFSNIMRLRHVLRGASTMMADAMTIEPSMTTRDSTY